MSKTHRNITSNKSFIKEKIKVITLAETSKGIISKESYELIAWAKNLLKGGNISPTNYKTHMKQQEQQGNKKPRIEIISVLPGMASNVEELCYRGADRVIHLVQKEFNHFLCCICRLTVFNN